MNSTSHKTHLVSGEKFILFDEDNTVTIYHPVWSLNGIGNSEFDAFMNLKNEAKLMSGVYLHEPEDKLSRESIRFKHFLKRFLS